MKTMKEIFSNWRRFNGQRTGTLDGVEIYFHVLTTPEEQSEGFMNKPEPHDGFGLFFLYPEERQLSFWMKNVPYDLDLVALDKDLRVMEIIHLKANDETSIGITNPCQYVIELRGGWCEDYGINFGKKFIFNEG